MAASFGVIFSSLFLAGDAFADDDERRIGRTCSATSSTTSSAPDEPRRSDIKRSTRRLARTACKSPRLRNL